MQVPWILATNSLLIKQETLKVEWFDYALKPYVHYYPVKRDLSNLLEVIDYLEQHQEEAQEITRNANKFVREYFTREKIIEIFHKAFRDYAKVQNYTFTDSERELIQAFGIPYHEFALYPYWKRDEMLRLLQKDRQKQWATIGVSSLVVIVVLICTRKLQFIKKVIQR